MTLSLHRCKVCGCRWLLWPDVIHGGGWNLLDKYSKPGQCCDNAPMGEQIEHLRDIPLQSAHGSTTATEPELEHAAKLLALSITDIVIEPIRAIWGNTEVAVIKHWRDEVIRLLAASHGSAPEPEVCGNWTPLKAGLPGPTIADHFGHGWIAGRQSTAAGSAPEATAEGCKWTEDDDGLWNTSCGKTWEFIDAGPAENSALFCHHCGKKIVAVTYIDSIDDEEGKDNG